MSNEGNNPAALGVLLAVLAVIGVPGLSDQLLGNLKIPAAHKGVAAEQGAREKKEGILEKLKQAGKEQQAKQPEAKPFFTTLQPHEIYRDSAKYSRSAQISQTPDLAEEEKQEEAELFYGDSAALRKKAEEHRYAASHRVTEQN